MNKFRELLKTGNIRVLLVPLILTAGLLAIAATGVVREYLIPAFLYLVLGIRIMSGTLPQMAWWILLVFLLLIIASTSLVLVRRNRVDATPSARKLPSRLEFWIDKLEQGNKGGYFSWSLAHEISLLSLRVLELDEKAPLSSLSSSLKNSRDAIDPEIQRYILTGLDAKESFQKPAFSFSEFFSEKKAPVNLEPVAVIHFLESILDIEQLPAEVPNGNEY
jgi:hypothetical protein